MLTINRRMQPYFSHQNAQDALEFATGLENSISSLEK
jgi:hypothetical protein